MRKIYVLAILMVAVVPLVATGSKYSDSMAEHLQSVSTGQATPTFTMWEWIEYVREAWVYEPDRPGERCQQPQVSDKRLKGDCDDFAVMVAYYIEEYWGFDTFIVWINMEDAPDHYVAFVHVGESLKNSRLRECLDYPSLTRGKRFYIPIDFTKCPGWHWLKTGGSIETEEWEDLAGTPR